MRPYISGLVVAVLSFAVVCRGVATGQPAARAPRVSAAAAGAAVPVPRVAATVFGYIWNVDNAPIPNAALRLRNVGSGRMEMTTTSNESGEFTFTDVEGASYAIEYVDDRGKVLAIGHTFSIAPGETVVTFIRLGARLRLFSGFFTSAAAAAVASAAGLGVTAVAPTGQDVSPIVP